MFLVGNTASCARLTGTTLGSETSIIHVSRMAEFVCCLPETDISSVETVSHMLQTQIHGELHLIRDRSNVS
jgi:predicted aminopeptidase